LLDAVAPPAAHRDVRTVDVHIRWLRAKLELERHPSARLVTVRGVGYRLDPGTPARRRTNGPPLVDESQSPLTRR
jgi:DNA-binding response OmpR family regulator